ncbi:hypothetical protein AWB80_04041 [Caballeronia pedi]|uniref:Histidine utilization protein HutD n=1 Tax=Caballeronia pedi TaxID=1777141 RepID=A0A158BSK9_9BURK|nr:HutD family protein [Caballeronia pedi]SAK73078.1 hypothetical protein AWB80_04041 [Caballeronia pedi]
MVIPKNSFAHGALRLLDCAKLAPEPWKNGAGTTRTVASELGVDGEMNWRVSLATLTGPSKFSQFPGLERVLMPLGDGAVELRSQDGARTARPGQPVSFSGDLHIWASVPTEHLEVVNVMIRRNTLRANVSAASHSLRLTLSRVHLLLCVAGQWSVSSPLLNSVLLQSMNGVLLEDCAGELEVHAAGPSCKLVSIAIESVER